MTTTAKESLLKQSGGHCIYCGHELTVANMTVDHIIPKSAGGKDAESNLIACCKECNAQKADQALGVFLLQKGSAKRIAYLNRLNTLINGKKISPEKAWLLQGNPPAQVAETTPLNIQCMDSDELLLLIATIKIEEDLRRQFTKIQSLYGFPDPEAILEPVRSTLKDLLYNCITKI